MKKSDALHGIGRLQNLADLGMGSTGDGPSRGAFLFGARGTGKTTLLRQLAPPARKDVLWIDLLSASAEHQFFNAPDRLEHLLLKGGYTTAVIDEVQKVPKLLDIVHRVYEMRKGIHFFVTASSARKLKRGQANLLAGRLFLFHLYPFTHIELGERFLLDDVLHFGSLPRLWACSSDVERRHYLDSYVQAYLKEEVLAEQLVRGLKAFKNFAPIAAQYSGQRLNFSKIARVVGVDYTTIQKYFDILSDTYLGFYLYSFHRSVCKQQRAAPKFYLFDIGVVRALDQHLQTPLKPQTYEYGRLFEHFLILEVHRLNDYFSAHLDFSYLQDKGGAEVDLIIRPPQGPELLVEIKSTHRVEARHATSLNKFLKKWDQPARAQVWSQDPFNRRVDDIEYLHWQEGLRRLFKK